MMKFFTYNHHGEGMEYHDTELEAKKYAQELLNSYIQNNDENNINICWGGESSNQYTLITKNINLKQLSEKARTIRRIKWLDLQARLCKL